MAMNIHKFLPVFLRWTWNYPHESLTRYTGQRALMFQRKPIASKSFNRAKKGSSSHLRGPKTPSRRSRCVNFYSFHSEGIRSSHLHPNAILIRATVVIKILISPASIRRIVRALISANSANFSWDISRVARMRRILLPIFRNSLGCSILDTSHYRKIWELTERARCALISNIGIRIPSFGTRSRRTTAHGNE
jgi:hypothetical protein